MNIERALQITGWMTPRELEFLATEAARHDNIVEVGSWQGRSTRALIDNARGQVTAVDTFCGSLLHDTYEKQVLAAKPPNWLRGEFDKNTAGTSNLRVIQMESVKAASSLKDEKFDMIFIDDDHEEEPCYESIMAWKALLATGGLMCGHDARYSAVTNAVHRAFGGRSRIIDFIDTDIWVAQ